ncbi:Ubiquitin [Metarhizium album ARSEF 1941]|uniref:Ubiquitin n=1 Tax=Metarhizium album (strain ARSEF 1941) TaxID=1081103 RepID=A0A0B2WRC6_METAS|nr:Ubiquitin [Metarhizium album ARSEF 1941]KHN98611.1 Ubiquitin [Metarhizium album ARSEF 1941]
MGCCFSRSAGPNSPYPGGAPNASARHINPPPVSLPESVQTGSRAFPHPRRRDQDPLDEHINKPLRRHVWKSADRQWTKQQLDDERAEFFDTRVSGRSEIWQTIHAAVTVLQEPGGEGCDALGTAQSILSAAEISLPTGDLANGVYDSLGNYYQLPQWVVSDPSNISTPNEGDEVPEMSMTGDDGTTENEISYLVADSERRRQEKGKEVIDGRDQITLRARLSENGRDFDVRISKLDTVRNITRKLACQASLPTGKKIRIAYMGKMLNDNQSLEIQGWQTGHVVNALVFNRD